MSTLIVDVLFKMVGEPVSASATSATHTVAADGDFYFTVTAIDAIGNETSTACSATKIEVDTIDPTAANTLSWSEGAYNTSTSVTATWTVGGAGDAASQELRVFTDASCSSQSGATVNIANATDNSRALTLAGEGDYYFKVTTTDDSGRTSDSVCSSKITID